MEPERQVAQSLERPRGHSEGAGLRAGCEGNPLDGSKGRSLLDLPALTSLAHHSSVCWATV